MDPLILAAIMDEGDPVDLLKEIVGALHASDDPNRAAGDLGAGPLETLIGHHEYDCLISPLLTRLSNGDGASEISEFLWHDLQDHFGLDPLPGGTDDFAAKIVVWFRSFAS